MKSLFKNKMALLACFVLITGFSVQGSLIAQDQTDSTKAPPATATTEEPTASPNEPAPTASTLDQETIDKLTRYLTGSKWTGNFTVTGKEDQELTPETYEIVKAQKVSEGDLWLLSARIKYGNLDRVFDLPPIEIKVVGEAPMIIFNKLTIPGLGTFDARVLIRNNKYAGTWMHDDVGGHLFGTIKRKTTGEKTDAKDKQ